MNKSTLEAEIDKDKTLKKPYRALPTGLANGFPSTRAAPLEEGRFPSWLPLAGLAVFEVTGR